MNGEYFVPLSRAEGLVGQSKSGGSADSSIPFPEITVTLNIDTPENVCEVRAEVFERAGNQFEQYMKDYTQGETAPAQSVITGAILPIYNNNDNMNYYGFSIESVHVVDGNTSYYYDLSFSEVVNLRDMGDEELLFEVIDPTKPISCTITATKHNGK